jgi:hypothetical protein
MCWPTVAKAAASRQLVLANSAAGAVTIGQTRPLLGGMDIYAFAPARFLRAGWHGRVRVCRVVGRLRHVQLSHPRATTGAVSR